MHCMFLTLDTDSRGSVIGSVILGVDVNSVTHSGVMNTSILEKYNWHFNNSEWFVE